MLNQLPDKQKLYEAIARKDGSLDGLVYVCVKTTGIFCRPVCPARTPKAENVDFVSSIEDALAGGYRPCKRCRPLEHPDSPSALLQRLLELVEADPSRRWSEADLRALGVEPATARRHFQRRFDMTFSQYVGARRLGHAFKTIKEGDRVIEAQLDAGFESGSGFRNAFARQFGDPPNRSRDALSFVMAWLDTPLGPMLAVADENHLHMLEFVERSKLADHLERYRTQYNASVTPGDSPALARIRQEVTDYFSGRSLTFASDVAGAGTDFQRQTWSALRAIPPGETRSYADLAKAIGRPGAVRAVANANRQNRCAIILPCHRVIGSDGSLTGYAGGLWRKQWLLEHEQRHTGKTLL